MPLPVITDRLHEKKELISTWSNNISDPDFDSECIEFIVNEAMRIQRTLCAQAVSDCEKREGTERINMYEAMGACLEAK